MPGVETSDGTVAQRASAAVQRARAAFTSQSGSLRARGQRALEQLEAAVRAHEDEFIEALRADFGKPELESVASELSVLYQEIGELKQRLKRFFRPARRRVPLAFFRSSSRVLREPYGLVLVISPWNYPLQLSLVPVAGAIAAGNSVVLKPSELAPHVADLLETVLTEAFPDGLVSVVNGDRTAAEALLRNRFDHIFYTGNTTVGRIIMEAASAYVIPVTLELGGKSPAIVTSNADLRVAAQRVAWGKCFNAGQTCVAPDYLVVESAVHDEFIGHLKDAMTAMYGSSSLGNRDLARIINNRHFERISGLLDRTRGNVWGGSRDRDTRSLSPAVVTGLDWDDPLMSEEIFGPVLPVLRYDSMTELSRQINSRPRPLALYVFSSIRSESSRVLAQIPSGGGCINDVVLHVASSALPFGGVGDSGFGRYRGIHSLRTFTYERAIVDHKTWPEFRFRYPPYDGKLKFMRLMLGR